MQFYLLLSAGAYYPGAMRLLKAKALRPGGCFGLIALSSSARPDSFRDGAAALERAGFRVRTAFDPCAEYERGTYLFSSAAKETRAAALHSFFEDPEIDVVASVRGGYGALELLPLIDFRLLADHPKPLLGISDTSALLAAAYGEAGIPAIHAPAVAGGFSEIRRSEEARESFAAVLKLLSGGGGEPPARYPLTRLHGAPPAEGALIGGNLATLSALIGTPWEPDFTDHILFLEDVGEKPYRVHRMLLQMRLAGKLEGLRGVVFGRMQECVHPQGLGPGVDDVIRDIFREADYPVAIDAPFGHQALNMPLPLGVHARITENALDLLDAPVLA